MKVIEVVLESGNKATLFLSGNFVVSEYDKPDTCRICDGVHNNGGWKVRGSYRDIVTKLKQSLEFIE